MKPLLAHATNYFPGFHTHVGGAEHACARTIEILESLGYENIIFTLPFDHHDKNPNIGRSRFLPVPTIESRFPGPLRKYLEVVKWYAWQNDFLATAFFRKVLSGNPIKALNFYNAQFLTLDFFKVAKSHGLKTVYTVYDYWLFCPLTILLDHRNTICRKHHGPNCSDCLPPVFSSIQRFLLRLRSRWFQKYFSSIDKFIVLSQASANLLTEMGVRRDKIEIIPVPIDLDSYHPGESDIDDKLIIFAGWYQHRKGLDLLLRAMPEVVKENPGAKLEIYGGPVKWEPDYEAALRKLVSLPEIANNVKMIGKIPQDRLAKRLRESAIVVIPEQWENMSPLLLLEAMALGKVVIAGNIGGIPEFLEDGKSGFLFKWDDPSDLGRKINEAFRRFSEISPLFKKTASERIRKLLDPRIIAKKLDNLFCLLSPNS